MKNPMLVPEVRALLSSNNVEAVKDFCTSTHPATVAEFLSALQPEEIRQVLSALDAELAAQIFSHLDEDIQSVVVEPLRRDELARLVTHMAPDERVDLLKRIPEEKQEDMEKFIAIGGSHEAAAYLRTPAWSHFKNRCGWIVVLAILGLVSGLIVQNFEGLLLQFAILATFMPMLADTGGNTGSQSATLVVRALALGEVRPRDVLRVLSKEFVVSGLLALALAVFCFARVWLFAKGTMIPEGISLIRIGFAVALALGLQVVTPTLIGALLPLGAAKLKFDPAVVASPALTTIVDISGLLIFFTTAKLVLSV